MSTASTQDRRSVYEADGFILCPEIGIPAPEAAVASSGLLDVRDGKYDTGREPDPSPWKPGGPADRLVKIENPQLANHALRKIIAHEGIGRAALEITGAKWVQVWWVQGLVKPSTTPPPPGQAAPQTNVGWHQDKQYWKEWQDTSELFTGWLALSNVPSVAGPMLMAKGSHKWGLLGAGDFFAQNQADLLKQIKVPEGQKWDEVQCVLPQGGISFHNQLTFHASGPNTSGFPRVSLALHLRTDRSKTILDEKGNEPWVAQWINDTTICPRWER